MAEVKDPDKVRMGYFYSYCCEQDLTPIESEEELEQVQHQMREDRAEQVVEGEWAGTGLRVWESMEEALEALENSSELFHP